MGASRQLLAATRRLAKLLVGKAGGTTLAGLSVYAWKEVFDGAVESGVSYGLEVCLRCFEVASTWAAATWPS